MQTKYTPGCECCSAALIFVPQAIKVVRNVSPSLQSDEYTEIFLDVFSQNTGDKLKTISIWKQPAKVSTKTFNGVEQPHKYNYTCMSAISCCNHEVVAVAYTLQIKIYRSDQTGIIPTVPPEAEYIWTYNPIVEYENVNRICFIRYSDYTILADVPIDIPDPMMMVANCCINAMSEVWVGIHITAARAVVYRTNNRFGQFFQLPEEQARLVLSDETSFVQPTYNRETYAYKIKWDGSLLNTILLGQDAHEKAWLITDMFWDSADRLLVTLYSSINSLRTIKIFPNGDPSIPFLRYVTAEAYPRQSCLKMIDGEEVTVFHLTRTVDDLPKDVAYHQALNAEFTSVCVDSEGNIFVGARGYSEENIFPETFKESPSDFEGTPPYNQIVPVPYFPGVFPDGTTVTPIGPITGTLVPEQVYQREWNPYVSIFKHNGGSAGDYSDWDMLIPRYYSHSFEQSNPFFLSIYRLRCSLSNTLYYTLASRKNSLGDIFVEKVLHPPYDSDHNTKSPSVNGVPTVFPPETIYSDATGAAPYITVMPLSNNKFISVKMSSTALTELQIKVGDLVVGDVLGNPNFEGEVVENLKTFVKSSDTERDQILPLVESYPSQTMFLYEVLGFTGKILPLKLPCASPGYPEVL